MTLASTTVLAAPPPSSPDRVEVASAYPFAQTVERLTGAIEGAGMTLFARIDHQAAAQQVGLTMPPTQVLLYGNPQGGTPLMVATPAAALDLPLRVLVREAAGGQAWVSFHPIEATLRAAGVPAEKAAALAPAQRLLVKAVQP